MAVDRRDHDLRQAPDGGHEFVHPSNKGAGVIGVEEPHLLNVGARAECPAIAGKHDHRNLMVSGKTRQRLGRLAHQG